MTTLTQALTQARPLPPSPYRGIECFRYIDQQIFAAREDETWDVLSNVLIYRGVLLYGDSGSGKSSLVNAGLIAAALKERLIPNRLRIQPRRGKEIKIERIPTESEDKPPYLPSIFISDKDRALSLEISLRDFCKRLIRLEQAPADEPRPLLIFDQFEEFITLFEEALRGGDTAEAKLAQKEAPEVQRTLLRTFTRLMEREILPIKVLFVFREDYLAKLNLLFEACPDLLDQYVRLLPPRVEEAEKIIRAPFVNEELKSSFIRKGPGQGGKEIPEQLARAIAVQLQERSENGFINLSELQLVCRKLWESPDPVRFFQEKNGNIQKILEEHWADVLVKLGELYDPAIALLGHMVTSSNTRNIVSEHDLRNHEKDSFTPRQIEGALEALIERQLVRREPRHQIYFYEIASEFLVPWIQQKKAARHAKIEARKLAAERQKRNLWIGVSVLGTLLALATGLAFYSIQQRKAAEVARVAAVESKRQLEIENDRAGKIIDLMTDLTSENAEDRLRGVQELDTLVKDHTLQPQLAPVILATVVNDKDSRVSSAASTLLSPLLTQESSKGLRESIIKSVENNPEIAKKLPARVYIQISSNSQRPRADKIANALRNTGIVVPAYALMDIRHAPSKNELRYYKSPEGSGASSAVYGLNEILKTIRDADGQPWKDVPLPPSSSVRPGHFEIWFSADRATLTLIFEDEKGGSLKPKSFSATLTPADGGTPITRSYLSPSNLGVYFSRLFAASPIIAAPGEYELSVQMQGFLPYKKSIELKPGKQDMKVQLAPAKSDVSPSKDDQPTKK